MQCTNNLKQLSLSTHNYHDVQGGFPAGASWIIFKTSTGTSWTNNDYYFSGLIQLFPYAEQQAKYDAIYSTVYSATSGGEPKPWSAGNADWVTAGRPLSGNISALQCPSDNTVRTEGNADSRSTYCMSRGDGITRDQPHPGISPTPANAYNRRGVFPCISWQSMASVTDGTSNTIAFSEAIAGTASNRDVKGSVIIAATGANLKTDPLTECGASAVLESGDKRYYKSTMTATGCYRTQRYADARWAHATFHTINQPNGPSCNDASGDGRDNYGVWTASSNHSGGVNCGLVDGSVRFVSDTISNKTAGVTTAKEKSSGESDFGVWGAYGTVNGGETSSL